jgi:hypothetical protein
MATAIVVPRDGRWNVSANGSDRSFVEKEEAVEEARRMVRSSGGGTVEIHDRQGVRDRINVPAPTPPRREPEVDAETTVAAPRPARTPSEQPTSKADVARLRSAYEQAWADMAQTSDDVDRQIGLATIRIDAAQAHARLAAAPHVSERDLAPMTAYVRELKGGEAAEWSVKQVDRYAAKVLRDAFQSLVVGAWVGAAASVVAFITSVSILAQDAGAGLGKAALGGGVVIAVLARVVYYGSKGTEKAWIKSWGWAGGLGRRAENALAPVREIEKRILKAPAAALAASQTFAARARTRAQIILGLTWSLLAFAAIMAVIGAGDAISDKLNQVSDTYNQYNPQRTLETSPNYETPTYP